MQSHSRRFGITIAIVLNMAKGIEVVQVPHSEALNLAQAQFHSGITIAEDVVWIGQVLGASDSTWEHADDPQKDTVWDFI